MAIFSRAASRVPRETGSIRQIVSMGIRFYCPKGHRLHVKSFLAGKRGLCPHCGTRVQIPTESQRPSSRSDSAAQRAESRAAAQSSVVADAPSSLTPSASTMQHDAPSLRSDPYGGLQLLVREPENQQAAPAPPAQADVAQDPIEEAPQAVWYVRPPSGGQFGPAPGEVMRQWIEQGRVSDDSLVWREGWSDWRTAAEVFRIQDSGTSPPAQAIAAPAVAPPVVTEAPRSQVSGQQRRRNVRSTAATAVAILTLISIVLLGVLLFLIFRS